MIVDRARALVGCCFRPQGRDPGTGLDCVGVVMSSCLVPTAAVRRDYRLLGNHLAQLREELRPFFRRVSPRERRPGDVLLIQIAPEQLHLAIHCGDSFVHADASIRKVVETPGSPPWKCRGVYRRRVRRLKRKN